MAYYEEGLYNATILEHGLSESRHKKTPFVWLRCKIDGGAYDREVRLWVTDKTADYTIAKLRAVGWSGGSFATLEAGGGSSLRNQRIKLICRHEEYQGQAVERWDFPSASQAAENQEPQSVPGMAAKLDSLYGAALTDGQTSEPIRSSDEDWQKQIEEAGEDDIPF